VPPACEKIHLISGNCSAEPLNSKLAIVRVVSVPSSISASVQKRLLPESSAGRIRAVYAPSCPRPINDTP
jgi:hypothetical protein